VTTIFLLLLLFNELKEIQFLHHLASLTYLMPR
jgi:hypothetical protein